VNGNPFGVFAVAKAPSKSLLNEAIYSTKTPLPLRQDERTFSSKRDKPLPNAKSDYARKVYFDDEGHRPIPESRRIPKNQ
jgi:hypothetical protein